MTIDEIINRVAKLPAIGELSPVVLACREIVDHPLRDQQGQPVTLQDVLDHTLDPRYRRHL